MKLYDARAGLQRMALRRAGPALGLCVPAAVRDLCRALCGALGVPLAALGGVLLATRALDALVDPLIGRWAGRAVRARGATISMAVAALAALCMALGFAAVWMPPPGDASYDWPGWPVFVWTYLAFSVLSVVHQAWGARWGGNAAQRARIVAWREGAALPGVVLASLLPAWLGFGASSAALAVLLLVGVLLLARTAPVARLPA